MELFFLRIDHLSYMNLLGLAGWVVNGRLRQKDTANPDAYRAFLKGRETARQRTPRAYDRALAMVRSIAPFSCSWSSTRGSLRWALSGSFH